MTFNPVKWYSIIRERNRNFLPPERSSFDVGVVIVVVHYQDPPLEHRTAQVRFTSGVWRPQSSCRDIKHLYLQPHPSVHRLLHLHGKCPRPPVHHGVTELMIKDRRRREREEERLCYSTCCCYNMKYSNSTVTVQLQYSNGTVTVE